MGFSPSPLPVLTGVEMILIGGWIFFNVGSVFAAVLLWESFSVSVIVWLEYLYSLGYLTKTNNTGNNLVYGPKLNGLNY